MALPRNEYPRPDLVRGEWLNLNGEWEFEVDNGDSGTERRLYERQQLSNKITVPFAPESKLSGLEWVDFMRSVWYRRSFTLPDGWKGGRVLLHFGAVDYRATVWVNGRQAGFHRGGYTPFVLDITGLLQPGENTLCVNARDDVRDPLQPSGKQCGSYQNFGCMYTRSTGIWQTVWLEHVPQLYIKSLRLTPDVPNARLLIHAKLSERAAGAKLVAEASLDGKACGTCEAAAEGEAVEAVLPLSTLRLWNPGEPVLYSLTLTVGEDRVASYFGMREVVVNGRCIEINGKKVFQRLVLDQGYYPDGIYTAPTDEDLKHDIELSMAAGFNGARLHMKIFEPRFLYWADKLGYLVWGEYPNWGLNTDDDRSLLSMLPEWLEELERDYSHPAIIGWCPFNETGEHRSAEVFRTVYQVTKALDSTRPMIDTSGYTHAVTDIYDVHDYDQNPETFHERYQPLETGKGNVFVNFPNSEKYEGQPYFVSEFGGIRWSMQEDNAAWGYGDTPKSLEEFYTRYEGLVGALLQNPGICAFCYTQLTDVMQEQNGVYTFDRQQKFDLKRIRDANTQPAACEA